MIGESEVLRARAARSSRSPQRSRDDLILRFGATIAVTAARWRYVASHRLRTPPEPSPRRSSRPTPAPCARSRCAARARCCDASRTPERIQRGGSGVATLRGSAHRLARGIGHSGMSSDASRSGECSPRHVEAEEEIATEAAASTFSSRGAGATTRAFTLIVRSAPTRSLVLFQNAQSLASRGGIRQSRPGRACRRPRARRMRRGGCGWRRERPLRPTVRSPRDSGSAVLMATMVRARAPRR